MRLLETLGAKLGKFVQAKNDSYGSSFSASAPFFALLYPNGITIHQFRDALLIARVFDKLMRIATRKDAFGESPWLDIAGYGLLGASQDGAKLEGVELPDLAEIERNVDRALAVAYSYFGDNPRELNVMIESMCASLEWARGSLWGETPDETRARLEKGSKRQREGLSEKAERDHDRLEQCLVLLNDLCGPLGVECGASMFGKEGLRERAIELRSAYVALVKERGELELASLHFERALVAIVNDPHAGAAEVAAVARKALAARDPDRPGRIKTANQAGELALDPEAPRVLAAKAAPADCRSPSLDGYKCSRMINHEGLHGCIAGAEDGPRLWWRSPEERASAEPDGVRVRKQADDWLAPSIAAVSAAIKTPLTLAVAEARRCVRSAREHLGKVDEELSHHGGPDVSEALEAARRAGLNVEAARRALEPYKNVRRPAPSGQAGEGDA